MRILQVTNKVPYPSKDGGAIACMNLCKGFAHLGNKVTVLSMNTLKHHVELDEIPDSIKDLAEFHLVNVPAPINAFAALGNLLFSKKPYNAVRFIDKHFEKELAQLLEENTFDIIQLEGLYVLPYIPVIRSKSNATVVYRAHNIEFEIWQRTTSITKGLSKRYFKILTQRIRRFEIGLLNSYDLLVPITDRDGDMLDELGNTKPKHVSPTGIDASVLVPNAKNIEHPSLFHIGSLEWSPNQEGLVWFLNHCWFDIHKRYPELKFYIAGRNAPQWLIKKFDLPNVIFEGEVADAYDFMNSKSIMVVPLFSGSGMRIKIIEGMALGKSIVSTPIGAEGLNISPNENILIAEERELFTSAISELIDNRELFDKIGKNAIEFILEKFDNLEAAGKLIEFYKLNAK